MTIDQSIISKEVIHIYIANSDDKNILFHCSDQSWYNLYYPLTNSPIYPRYLSSGTGIQNVWYGTITAFVEDFNPTPPPGAIGSIGATITTNKGQCVISGVCDPFGVHIELDLVNDIENWDENGAVRNVSNSPTDTRDYTELVYWVLKKDF